MTDFPLSVGADTAWGTVDGVTLTAYRMTDGSFVPFTTVHPRKPATPLITFG
jgi:hypothetical protein